MIRIPKEIGSQLEGWVKDEYPNEASGYLFMDNTVFCRIITRDKSRTHFMDETPENLLGHIEEYGKPSAIFHSHPHEAVPSYEDLKYMMTTIPIFECVWLIMGSDLKIRAWTIRGNHSRYPQRGETIRAVEIRVEEV